MKFRYLIFILFLYLSSSNAHAVMVSPSNVNAGELTLGATYNYSFTLMNSDPYDVDVIFGLTPNSQNLNSYVTFDPSEINSLSQNQQTNFDVSIRPTSSLSNGSHSLVFQPQISIEREIPSQNTGNITATGYLIVSSAASIDFSVNIPSGNGGVVSPTTGGGAFPTTPHIIEYKEATIELPWIIEFKEPKTIVEVKIKNTGKIPLVNSTVNVTSKTLKINYDKYLGNISVNEQKIVKLEISKPTKPYNFVNITITNPGNTWYAEFLVYSPDIQASLIKKDCIVFAPQHLTIKANQKSSIKIGVRNTCDFDIHNINVIMSRILDITEIINIQNIDKMGKNKEKKMNVPIELPEGIFSYIITFNYDEGETSGALTIESTYLGIGLFDMLIIILIGAVIFLAYTFHKDVALLNKRLKYSIKTRSIERKVSISEKPSTSLLSKYLPYKKKLVKEQIKLDKEKVLQDLEEVKKEGLISDEKYKKLKNRIIKKK